MHLELLNVVFDEIKVQKDLESIKDILTPVVEEQKNQAGSK